MKKEKQQQNQISLKFSVTGKPVVTIDRVNLKQPLKVAVEKALEETGTSRPIEDYDVLLGINILDITKKVEELGLTDGALIMVSLKSGKGGKL